MTPPPPGAQERAEQIVEAVVREMNRSDVGISVKDWDAHVRKRRENAARVVTDAVAQAVQAAFDDVDEIVGTWAAAYPEDVFRPFVASDHPHVSPDRIGAEMGRHMARELRKQIAALRARPAEP